MQDTSQKQPHKVALFSGHMIDAPGREKPRFPPDKEPIATRAIAQTLAQLGVDQSDLAICGGACVPFARPSAFGNSAYRLSKLQFSSTMTTM